MQLSRHKEFVSKPQHEHISNPGSERKVFEWRRDQALRAGVSSEQAEAIAHDVRFDFHALLVLIDRGCPGELAVRILAPLDSDPEPS